MANQPAFASTPVVGVGLLGSAETNLQVPTTTSTILTGGTNGTKIEEIVCEASKTTLIPTTVAGLVYFFIYNGTTYYLFDVVTVTAITASATTPGFRSVNRYPNLWLPANTWSFRASQSIAGNATMINVVAFGANY